MISYGFLRVLLDPPRVPAVFRSCVLALGGSWAPLKPARVSRERRPPTVRRRGARTAYQLAHGTQTIAGGQSTATHSITQESQADVLPRACRRAHAVQTLPGIMQAVRCVHLVVCESHLMRRVDAGACGRMSSSGGRVSGGCGVPDGVLWRLGKLHVVLVPPLVEPLIFLGRTSILCSRAIAARGASWIGHRLIGTGASSRQSAGAGGACDTRCHVRQHGRRG